MELPWVDNEVGPLRPCGLAPPVLGGLLGFAQVKVRWRGRWVPPAGGCYAAFGDVVAVSAWSWGMTPEAIRGSQVVW